MKFPDKDDLVEIPLAKIFDYAGFPIYKVTSMNVDAKNSFGQTIAIFASGYTYEWMVFNSVLMLKSKDANARYYTYKSLID